MTENIIDTIERYKRKKEEDMDDIQKMIDEASRSQSSAYPWERHVFGEEELKSLLEQVAKEQDRNTRHNSCKVLTNHVYSWQEQGGKLTDPEFLNQLNKKLMDQNADKATENLTFNED